MVNFIHFKNIDFSYNENDYVFQNLDLQIKKGQKIGLVGHSGSGKSTLMNLLLKNFAISNYKHWNRSSEDSQLDTQDLAGDILINQQSIYDVSSDSLRANISVIPQDIMLFHRTIGENIGYGKRNASMEEIHKAAEMANIHEFIMGLPNQYDTQVGERGVKLSGGQRQRIAIARAVLKNAPILILDEATSALDSRTEREIQKSIDEMFMQNQSTVIAIAHRFSTIKHLDRIIVLDNGKIIEDGAFDALMSINNGYFQSLWNNQIDGMLTR